MPDEIRHHEPHGDSPSRHSPPTRRTFLAGSAAVGAVAAYGSTAPQAAAANTPAGLVNVRLVVNGELTTLCVEPRVSLLDALRDHLRLTGTKKGCAAGACGACTVLVNGQRINSCLTLAAMHADDVVTTVEGLARGEELHPVQAAFIEHDGLQCGYCTPGQIMSGVACIREGHATTDAQTREWMSGNLCRCGAYNGIVEAVRTARSRS